MHTVASLTEAHVFQRARREVWRSVVDVRHLLDFRTSAIRRPSVFVGLGGVFVGLTLAAAFLPALSPEAGSAKGYALDALVVLPTAMAGVVLLAIVSAVASGGGRELLSREHAVVYPVSPTTDHLGALLLAPLNISWLLQAWLLLGATAYAVDARQLPAAQIGMVVWLALATAVGQVAAWTMEAVRRTRHGIAIVRCLGIAVGVAAVALQLTGNLGRMLDSLSTKWVVAGLVDGFSPRWLATVGCELFLLVAAACLNRSSPAI